MSRRRLLRLKPAQSSVLSGPIPFARPFSRTCPLGLRIAEGALTSLTMPIRSF
jgi:hypothetical protein